MGRFSSLRSYASRVIVLMLLLAPQASAAQHLYVFVVDTTGSIRPLLSRLRLSGADYLNTIPVDSSSQVWILTFESGLNEERFQRVLSNPKDLLDARLFLQERVVVHGLRSSHVFRSLNEALGLIEAAVSPGPDTDVVIHLFSDGQDTGPSRYIFEQDVEHFNALRKRFNSQIELCCHSLETDLPPGMQELIRKTPGMSAIHSLLIPPKARFTVPTATVKVGDSLTFINQTIGVADVWKWDFGDGTSSQERTPTHVYRQAGQHVVSLTATNSSITEAGGSSSAKRSVAVTVQGTRPTAKFEIVDPNGLKQVDVPVQFRDLSGGEIKTWSWSFGYGKGTSTAQHPQYTYTSPESYQVTLKVANEYGQDEASRSLTVGRLAFSIFPPTPQYGQPVKFADESQGQLSQWKWDFGDGGTGSEASPVHVYAKPGTYTVSLTALDRNRKAYEIPKSLTVGGDPPHAAFTLPLPEFAIGQSFTIVDQSTGMIETRRWDMGDGTVYTERNITHAYKKSGTFTITLTVGGPVEPVVPGDKTATAQIVVTKPVLQFSIMPTETQINQPIVIVNTTVGEFSGWTWTFGDDARSDQKDPGAHAYLRHGTYTIRAAARGPDGEQYQAERTVTVTDVPPEARFSLQKETIAGESVSLIDQSTGTVDSWAWAILKQGATDGEVKYDQARVDHRFEVAGKYTVTLVVSNDSGQTSDPCSQDLTVIERFSDPNLVFSLAGGKKEVRGRAPLKIEIDNRSTGSIRQYRWDFGDDSTSDDKNPEHTYKTKGVYPVRVSVVDQKGGTTFSTESQNLTITVLRPRPWPVWADFLMAGGLYILLGIVACVRPFQKRRFVYEVDGRKEPHKKRRDKKFLWRNGEYQRKDTKDFTDGFVVCLKRDWLLRKRYYLRRLNRGRVRAIGPNEKPLAKDRLVRNARIAIGDRDAVVFLHFDDNRAAALWNHLAIAVLVMAALIAGLMWL